MEYCRAVTKKDLLCKKKVCANSVFCTHHKPQGSCMKFKYPIPTDLGVDYIKILPEELITHIYKMYFNSHVLEELKNYDPQGDFTRIDTSLDLNINIEHLERDYRLVCEHNLWDLFKRNHITSDHGYTRFLFLGSSMQFRKAFVPHYTRHGYGYCMINLRIFTVNMKILEYIANNGWFKYIMT
jgi:hypothetical protein